MEQEKITLPLSMIEVAEIIGFEATILLMDNFGGLSSFYIPVKPKETHKIAKIIGFQKHQKLCNEYGGETISIPRGTFRRLKKSLILEAGKDVSNRKLCMMLGVSERYILKVKAEAKADKKQGELF